MDNPFPGYHVICVAELLINGLWGSSPWIFSAGLGGGSFGIKVSMLDIDKIVLRTGSIRITGSNIDTGSSHPNSIPIVNTAYCRVKVWRVM